MTLALLGAGIFALSAVTVIVLIAGALRRALDEPDEWCDQVDQDIDNRTPCREPEPFAEVEAVVFEWPVMAPSARVIEFPRRGDAA